MSSTALAIGDPIIFEGQPSHIVGVVGGKVEFVSDLMHTREDGTEVPRFRTVASAADLLWSARLGAWYVWGRVLGKGRGGVGVDQRRLFADLRDIGVIPSRPGRPFCVVPVAGEQHGLYCDLFVGSPGVNWEQELRNIRTGEGLTDAAKQCCKDHAEGFYAKRLNHGYASPNDGDPGFDAVVATEGAN